MTTRTEPDGIDPGTLIADVGEFVRCESPSNDAAAVRASAEVVAAVGAQRLAEPPELVESGGAVHVRWRFGPGSNRVLVLGHHDTVWPIGTLEHTPFDVTGGRMTGPGCFDMKAGIAMMFHAVAGLERRRGLTLLITGDEEIGSPGSRELIESEAAGCSAALVLEASADGGALKTERKGAAFYELVAHGRAAHAGLEPERGVNALVELAHQTMAVAALGDTETGTTVVPTVGTAGTTPNTVPATGRLRIDVRAWSVDEHHRVDRALRALVPLLEGSRLQLTGGLNRPPLPAVLSAGLFDRAVRIAAVHGLPRPTAARVGGGSDGNFTAGMGVPTLDGLGAVGGGAHGSDEHVLVDMLPVRTLLLRQLIADLLTEEAGR